MRYDDFINMENQKIPPYRNDDADELAVRAKGSTRDLVRNIVTILIVVGVLASWWYGFDKSFASVKSAAVSIASGVASVFSLGQSHVAVDDALSTAGGDAAGINGENSLGASWQIRKSEQGDSMWSVYNAGVSADDGIAFKKQTVNGLKNITLITNAIPQDRIASNSLSSGKDYSFIVREAQVRFAAKVAEANVLLNNGAHLKDLDNTLRLAYQVANAPSYQFLYSLPAQDIQNLLE